MFFVFCYLQSIPRQTVFFIMAEAEMAILKNSRIV
ncbi:hypothetical protein BSNT_08819 [Bacillus subtilis subsp. natto BEST195]|nr:hypothetical protein BSNT_08819 [Bacillus subtilis subsp. natto BEST195]